METDLVTYVDLYKIKADLMKQVQQLDLLMEKAKPKHFDSLNSLVNNITLGVYDYPFNGMLNEKIIFTLKILKNGTKADIRKYMSIVGDKVIERPNFGNDLDSTLTALSDAKILVGHMSIFEPNEINFSL
ncbi:hypothetical protein SAMN05421827_1462 [Pedobacter terrae]|uniref:Uncharacterized protein n=1 Tax=Pedobacter terrae TaxID=405671 RepID=A0A1G8EQK9_9SPHI|nr:hypothetical protein [Pedobacter terrae]SDH72166.1 hypothetical protein SAMN05421827_1462 [Pedobacter terrae]